MPPCQQWVSNKHTAYSCRECRRPPCCDLRCCFCRCFRCCSAAVVIVSCRAQGQPDLFPLPGTAPDFFTDMHRVLRYASLGPVKSFCHHRCGRCPGMCHHMLHLRCRARVPSWSLSKSKVLVGCVIELLSSKYGLKSRTGTLWKNYKNLSGPPPPCCSHRLTQTRRRASQELGQRVPGRHPGVVGWVGVSNRVGADLVEVIVMPWPLIEAQSVW